MNLDQVTGFFNRQITRSRELFDLYPRQLWVLVATMAVDELGGGLLFPFLTLYVTRKFEISMTRVGFLFMVYMLAGFFGNILGGASSDKIGRKITAVTGLITSAACSVLLGLSSTYSSFMLLAFLAGFFGSFGLPAWIAMIADLLPEHQHTEGYGIMRIASNLSITIGPAIGGILAGINFLLIFILDAVLSLVAAICFILFLKETLPALTREKKSEPLLHTLKGYSAVLQNRPFALFCLIASISVLAYTQMTSTLGVYLRDTHGIPERNYGLVISLNAGMVVLLQYAVTRRVKGIPPFMVLAFGAVLLGFGFSMYAYTASYPFFLLAMAIITFGEMVSDPTATSLVAKLSPEDMRGRYMAVYGISWMVPEALGVTLGGLVMDNYDPHLLWYLTGILALGASLGYFWMHRRYANVLATTEP